MAKRTATKKTTTKKPAAKKSPKAKGTEQPKVQARDVEPLITDKNLRSLYGKDAAFQEEIDAVVGKKREAIAYSVSKEHLDKEIYALAKRLAKWTPEKFAAKWPLLEAYLDKLGVLERADKVQTLELTGGKNPGEEDEKTDEEAEAGGKPGPTFGGPASRAAAVRELAEDTGAALAGE